MNHFNLAEQIPVMRCFSWNSEVPHKQVFCVPSDHNIPVFELSGFHMLTDRIEDLR